MPSPPPTPKGCTNFKLRQLTRRVSQHYDRVVAASGLKTTQYSLLSHDRAPRAGAAERPRRGDGDGRVDADAQPAAAGRQRLGRDRARAQTADRASSRSRRAAAPSALEAQREWKRAQLALNERLGAARVVALHALLDDCLATLSEPELETSDA